MTLKGDPAGPPLFASITEQPVAAASLGQVYKATTLDGQTVAVKAQHGTWDMGSFPKADASTVTSNGFCVSRCSLDLLHRLYTLCHYEQLWSIMINYDELWWIIINYDYDSCMLCQDDLFYDVLWHTIGPHQEIQKGAEAFSGRLASAFLCHPRCSDLVAWSRRRCCGCPAVLSEFAFCPFCLLRLEEPPFSSLQKPLQTLTKQTKKQNNTTYQNICTIKITYNSRWLQVMQHLVPAGRLRLDLLGALAAEIF